VRDLGRLPGTRLLSRQRGLARAQGGHSFAGRAGILRHHFRRACRPAGPALVMKLLLTGLSHKTAPVQVREKLAIPEAQIPRALQELQKQGAAEVVILSTCNRVEFAVSTPDHVSPDALVSRF